MAFYGELTAFVDQGKEMDVAYFDFSKAFDSLPWSPCSHIGITWFE